MRPEECESRVVPADLWQYTGGGFGDWGSANNWSDGIPTNATDVEFAAGKGSCSITDVRTIKSLTIDNGYNSTIWIGGGGGLPIWKC